METIHARDSHLPYVPTFGNSCQIDTLVRCDDWTDRDIIAIPYNVVGLPDYTAFEDPDSGVTRSPAIPSFYNPKRRKVFFDLETFLMPEDLGFKRTSMNMSPREAIPNQRLGLAISIDDRGNVNCWDECQVKDFIDYLLGFQEIVSYNGLGFDNLVLSKYINGWDFNSLNKKTFDLYQHMNQTFGVRRRLIEWAQSILGVGNVAKSMIEQGMGVEDGRLVLTHTKKNNYPKILREGSAGQRRLVWQACFEDAFNTLGIYREMASAHPKIEQGASWSSLGFYIDSTPPIPLWG